MQALAEKHLPLVGMMVRRCPNYGREPEELYQQGCIGLMKALARYDPCHGTTFSTYAAAMILGEMRMLPRLNAPIHIPRPEREQRNRIRKAMTHLTAHLGREPTITELAALMRMDAAELTLLLDEVTVSSTDDTSPGGTAINECIADRDDWLTRVELHDLLSRLDDRDRYLMQLRYQQGLSQTETARILGITQMQVSRREAVLRRQLRRDWYGT